MPSTFSAWSSLKPMLQFPTGAGQTLLANYRVFPFHLPQHRCPSQQQHPCSLQNVSLIIFLLLFRTTTTYHTAHPRWHAPQQAVILGCPYVRMSVVNIQDTTIRTYVHTLPLPPEHPSATHRTYARASNQLHKTPHRSLMFSLIAHAQAEVLTPCT